VLDRFSRAVSLALLVLVALLVMRPYVDRVMFAATAPRPVEARGSLSDAERTNVEIFARSSPAVVQVAGRTVGGEASIGEPGEGVKSGTGFIWDVAGHIVTNNHVVEGVQSLVVRLASGEVSQADTVGTAPHYDLAVIRIRGGAGVAPPLTVGTSADLKVGQFAYAIGNPFGLDQSLTTGVISSLKRRLPTSEGREIADAIQTDAAINPGNSGGPLLDSAGRLIGVNTAIFSPSGSNAGIGFAIPVDIVNRIVPELIRTGRVVTPGIGIVAANEGIAARLGIDGVIVVRTVPGSPAERAGLQGIDRRSGALGDVIVEANGRPVHQLSDLTEQLESVGIGHKISLTIRRNGHTKPVEAEVADIGPSAA
jgi:S1-C subfamily serine protease